MLTTTDAASVTSAEADDEAACLLERARHALSRETGALWLQVTAAGQRLRLEIRDIARGDRANIGWTVTLSFARDASHSSVRERIKQALALRDWSSAPPVVSMTR